MPFDDGGRDGAKQKENKRAYRIFIVRGAGMSRVRYTSMTEEELNEELIEASSEDNQNRIKRLIKEGADVNARFLLGTTPLLQAVRARNLKNVKLLIKYGADVNLRDCLGYDPLNTSIFYPSVRSIFNALIKAGADVNSWNPNWRRPIFECIRYDDIQGIKTLIKAGADIHLKNGYGETPLMVASSIGNSLIESILIKAGAAE